MHIPIRLPSRHWFPAQLLTQSGGTARSLPLPSVFAEPGWTVQRSAARQNSAEACRRSGAIVARSAMTQPPLPAGETFFLDAFAVRQWDDPNYSGSRISWDKADFVKRIHEYHAQGAALVDGYAPFCKHVFVPNFVRAKAGAMPVTDANRHLLRCGYSSRRPEELPVLTRWFPAGEVTAPEARFLDVILYSAEQIAKEHLAMPGSSAAAVPPSAPWGIISIKAQDEDFETPMQPITMMRNALGGEHGGSGVALDRAAYNASVECWRDRAAILWGDRPAGE